MELLSHVEGGGSPNNASTSTEDTEPSLRKQKMIAVISTYTNLQIIILTWEKGTELL